MIGIFPRKDDVYSNILLFFCKLSTALAKFMCVLQNVRDENMAVIFCKHYEENPEVVNAWMNDDENIENLVEGGKKKKEVKVVG